MTLRKALVVDDSRLARVALSKQLTRRGLEVDVAGSGGEAIDYLRGNTPDVVFLDYMMPDMDGFEAARAIQALPERDPLPLVMYTSQDSDSDRARAREIGICGFLSKPTSDDGLDTVLRDVQSWQPPAPDPDALVDEEAGDASRAGSTTAAAPADEPDAPEDVPAGPASGGPAAVPEPEPASAPSAAAGFPARETERAQPAGPEATATGPDADELQRRAVQAARDSARDEVERQLDEAGVHWQHQLQRVRAEMEDTLQQRLDESAAAPGDLDQRLAALRDELRQDNEQVHRTAVEAAGTAAEQAVKQAAERIRREAEQAARDAAGEAAERALARQEASGPDTEAVTAQVDAVLTQRLEGLADSEVFREQLIASLNDHGVPVLKNALDQWVRDVAAEAAAGAVDKAVERGSEAMLKEAVAAAAESAAAEAHAAHARTRHYMLVGGAVLAVGVLAALLLAV
ncbi:response regulator [Aquisalimonas lutea]|uniref:response regulator n=1 Tax=Aquisalimonas lutea TaxID=1327750 RepID=UPI0025B4A818|nr:response regulator [Aquisalimonas lutea]MDN3516321.1 response regulator [Aquisalimonas lutea]